ncbi:hypothetical protein KA405_01020 [Patescibacteria group bacterium]|nr:hypothetical protein [Patescibacteria group bacterium]
MYADARQILDVTEEDWKSAGGLVYTPSYLSYETVLLSAGVIFQRTPVLTYAGPYSKEITIDAYAQSFQRKRLPAPLLTNVT